MTVAIGLVTRGESCHSANALAFRIFPKIDVGIKERIFMTFARSEGFAV